MVLEETLHSLMGLVQDLEKKMVLEEDSEVRKYGEVEKRVTLL